ncbi:unnamed protein product [Rotaria socialis]|uniref:Uncharacterized protein n=1 Tax=Rotaria socialis TaxID=392032 RepID=A0A818Q1M4_9BILA|nr:unnamed protein product [Rotaria socialis]CAF4552507.1 unnamed protein product [Rotaria socialis]
MRSLLHVICFFYAFIELQSILYDTNPFQFDCLHHFSNGSYVSGIIKYCIRPVDDQNSKMVNFSDVNHPNLTFSELYRLNVTSHEVLLWSSSIDLAERYQYYIDQPTKYNRFNEQFFNCTSPWFGSHCQYSFELVSHVTETPVNAQSKSHMANAITHQTCYILLECDRGLASMCLDWREVCDGRIDCLNGGVDESQCIELELNECNENEYQCHNGLCIPKKFWNDEFDEAECLDKSDLLIMPDCPNIYLQLYIFACAEYACRPDEGRFPCGDGQCVEDFGECHNGRHLLLTESLSVQGNLPYDCWITMVCLSKITDQVNGVSCEQFVNLSQILPGLETCEYPIQFPTIPVLLGHVRFLYHPKQIFNINLELALVPDYVCYDEKLCDYLTSTFHHGNLTCRYGYEMNLGSDVKVSDWKSIIDLVKPHFHGCITQHYHDLDTHASSLYACKNSSKYISKSRLLDGISDCFLNDDEQVFEWSCSLNHPYRFQCLNDNHCQSILLLRNICHQSERQNNFDQILFYEICDRATDLSPMIIDGKNHSDETDCELWQCDNVYTRCNGFWSCPYGDDEENCTRPICPKRFLPCISLHNSTLICLPANQVGNGIVDCFGASDELEYCRQSSENEQTYRFYCQSDKKCVDHKTLCDGNEDCLLGDDETFCKDRPGLCDESNFDNLTDLEYVLCQIGSVGTHSFSLKTASISPPLPTIRNSSVHIHFLEQHITFSLENFARSEICNFGLHVYHRLGSGNISNICFCPPIYYGDRCQYQNQRVSLTITLGFVQHQTIYAIVATLIEDDEDRQEIHSYHQLTQVPKFRCEQPFNIYLLYSVRPKNTSKKYRIHIDVFDKTSLIYLASWYLKIPFAFLPVNRLAIFLTLPAYRTLHSGMCPFQCYKGTCMKYSNEERFFCRCFSGWSGAQCHTQIDCSNCSSDSMCVGLIQNRPICVCPVGKFGTRCLLKQSCPINFCENNGQCVVIDDRPVEDSYICICPETFFGSRCQQIKSKIEISFHDMDVPSYLFAYIYSEINSGQPEPMFVMLQKVKMFQNIVKFYPMYLFYIVILKIDVSYYLAAIQQTDRADISTIISPAQRCVPFYELFSSELLTLPRIHRIKHYHVPCQNDINLQCFIDESYICLCTREHHSNCFLFNFNMTFMCEDDVYCENDGICLQDRPKCPESILCVCADCFFGDRCQFYAKGIGLTLEDMFRYVIRPNLTFKDQSIIVKLSAAITMIIFVAGLWNSLLAYLAFHQQKSREVGSGMYLHLSSIVSSLVVIMLTTKFWFVIFTHAHQSINRLVLHGGCVLLEIALKLFLNMSNWLNACVAIERVIAVFQGIHFNKRQSQCIARWILRLLPFVILGSLSHEFIYRGLFDDYEEQRVWCVFRYSKSAEKYSTVIQLFHFIAPFLINLLSAIFIIYSMARQRAMFQTRQSYKHQLLKQFNEHKQLIVSPIVFVILSVPRLLISLFSGCIKVSRNPWLYLSGYFISFIPSAFIFAIFVLPSTFYKKQFRESIVRWQRRFFRS